MTRIHSAITTTFRPLRSKLRPVLAISLVAAIGLGGFLFLQRPAQAVTGAGWQAGSIISDSVFYNSNDMTAGDIAQFLNRKVPACDTNGAKPSEHGGGTRASYGRSRGYPPPYVCLKDYFEHPTTHANNLRGRAKPAGSLSAAQIIKRAADTHDISVRALLVTLQKESPGPLITDDWPFSNAYRNAMGYGCPDTAPCDPQYAGFYNQVHNAARQFKRYASNPQDYRYKPFQTNSILFNPNAGCGAANVYVKTKATAGLYNYTPYQPNKAALDNLYGTGDGCSAYGNRNFWRLFNDWFGSAQPKPYLASYAGQSEYPELRPGETTRVYIRYKNNGTETWYGRGAVAAKKAPSSARPFKLITAKPAGRPSNFGSSWEGTNNIASHDFSSVTSPSGTTYGTNPNTVKPGETGTVTFTVSVPEDLAAGTYREYFLPYIDGLGEVPASSVFLDLTVSPTYASSYQGQSPGATIRPGESKRAYFRYKNTGNVTWYDDVTKQQSANDTTTTRLIAYDPATQNSRSSAFGAGWKYGARVPATTFAKVFTTEGRPYATNPHKARPGETVEFSFELRAPANFAADTYREQFIPYVVNNGKLSAAGFTNVVVPTAPMATPSLKTVKHTLDPLASKVASVSFINSGNTTWTRGNVSLKAVSGRNTDGLIQGVRDDGVASLREASVAPGATGTFTLDLRAAAKKTSLRLATALFNDDDNISLGTTLLAVDVNQPVFSAGYAGQSGHPAIRQNQPNASNSYVLYRNTGNIAWHDAAAATGGIKPVVLATASPTNRLSRFNADRSHAARPAREFAAVYDADGTTPSTNQHIARPGQLVKFEFTLTAPAALRPGSYREWFRPIVEGGAPWHMGGSAYVDITVRPAEFLARHAGQSPHPALARGEGTRAYLRYRNAGDTTWYDTSSAPAGVKPVVLATGGPINRLSAFNADRSKAARPAVEFAAVYNADGRTPSPHQQKVEPGQIVRFEFTLTAPAALRPGSYREWFRPIVEAHTSDMGGSAYLDVVVSD